MAAPHPPAGRPGRRLPGRRQAAAHPGDAGVARAPHRSPRPARLTGSPVPVGGPGADPTPRGRGFQAGRRTRPSRRSGLDPGQPSGPPTTAGALRPATTPVRVVAGQRGTTGTAPGAVAVPGRGPPAGPPAPQPAGADTRSGPAAAAWAAERGREPACGRAPPPPGRTVARPRRSEHRRHRGQRQSGRAGGGPDGDRARVAGPAPARHHPHRRTRPRPSSPAGVTLTTFLGQAQAVRRPVRSVLDLQDRFGAAIRRFSHQRRSEESVQGA